VVLVDRNHNADKVVRNVQQQNIGAHNNIANLVENIMAQNGLNIGLHRSNFVSSLSTNTPSSIKSLTQRALSLKRCT